LVFTATRQHGSTCFAAVNLVLFDPDEIARPLARDDRRAQHVITVLKRKVGDSFDAGVVNGPRGKATITAISEADLQFTFAAMSEAKSPPPVTLIVGLPRPQTARDILRDATSLGVAAIHFVATEKGEPGYAQSTLWSSGEWRRHVLAGAEQAFDTHVPEVSHGRRLSEVVAALPVGIQRLALDNHESSAPLGCVEVNARAVVLAVGSERGWSAAERDTLRAGGFSLVHLGTRVLRTETAVVAALAVANAGRDRA
jgi:RsmE family RNA methyltransferase